MRETTRGTRHSEKKSTGNIQGSGQGPKMQNSESQRANRFTLSGPPSEASSRAPSPAPILSNHLPSPPHHQNGATNEDEKSTKSSLLNDDETPGVRKRDVYDSTLSWWRAGFRRTLVATVQWESKYIARMQEMIRTPWLDAYFVYSSILGTHTFFMILLPALFFFGYDEMGRGFVVVLGLGIYFSSVLKDLFCSPRPFAPPVTRMTIGSHHLEYGFPSTHSTNSVSIALIFFAHIHRLAFTPIPTPDTMISSLYNNASTTITNATLMTTENAITEYMISPQVYILTNVILFIYAFSVVFGRLYTAMHSFTDCLWGVLLGAGIWWAHTDWAGIPYIVHPSSPLYNFLPFLGLGVLNASGSFVVSVGQGLGLGKWIENWIQFGGWEVPGILIPLCLLAVHHHPQPVDDCPCFEDAIAILSVVLGALVSRWAMCFTEAAGASYVTHVVMPGSGWVWVRELSQWAEVERGWNDVALWWAVAALKMAVGILAIFVWRLIAKSALHIILPPTFRLLARAFRLPHRRFYTPATEYKSVPSEFHSSEEGGGFELHPIPSVIDLPNTVAGVGVEIGGIGSGVESVSRARHLMGNGNGNDRAQDLKMRNGNSNGNGASTQNSVRFSPNAKLRDGGGKGDKEKVGKDGAQGADGVRHYDADVLTKVIVYAGIAVLSTEVLPLAFNLLGWGVKSHAHF